jgi:DNA ligase (NAD+)
MNNTIEFLNRAARHYYNGFPIISDEQFDRLADSVSYKELGSKQHEDVEKHLFRMYSLQKYYEDENTKNPLEGFTEISMTPKLDGAAVSLLYIEHKLARALTRGDGLEGRLVTDKFLATKLVPHTISKNLPEILQITGEIVAPIHVENARNYAAGALNLGSVEEFKSRAITFFAYGVYPYITSKFTWDMQLLAKNGFSTVQDKDINLIYPTDGVVFRIDNNEDFESLGHTAKHPRGAYARKERQDSVVTTLLDVEWQVGKSGRVTPVALLEPIVIEGKTVTRATLNNPGFIEALDLYIGCSVGVRLAGQIIPEVTHKVEG